MKQWLYFICSHSIFIACCAVAMVFQTALLLQLTVNPFLYGFIFFATLGSYNFYWLVSKLVWASPLGLTQLIKKEASGLLVLSLSVAGLSGCYYYYPLPLNGLLVSGTLTLLYMLPLLPYQPFTRLRKAGILKTGVLAFTWAYATVLIPAQQSLLQVNKTGMFVFTRRFLFMLMLCILFDNRDKAIDRIRGLHSLATVLQPRTLQGLIFLIFGLLFASNFLYPFYEITFAQSLAWHLSTLALLIVYFYSLKKRGYLFYYFFVDGMMIFSALATYIACI